MNIGDFIDAELNSKTYKNQNHTWYDGYPKDNGYISMGWQCPRCKRINSPMLMQCYCNEHQPYNPTLPMKPYCDSDTFKVHDNITYYANGTIDNRIDDIIC